MFGARSIFCNRLPLINAALAKSPDMRLAASAQHHADLRQTMRALQDSDAAPWKAQGFDGDHCMYNAAFHARVAQAFPDRDGQRRFYIEAYLQALARDPAPFLAMLLRQVVLGVEKTFDMFAIHTPHFAEAAKLEARAPGFLAGTSPIATGPLNDPQRVRTTLLGQAVNAALAVLFWTHAIAYFAVTLATLALPAVRWRAWDAGRRRAFLLYLALPLLVILAHHAVIGVSHSFDIRRYAFNLYFVNLAFVGLGGVFWLDELHRLRTARAAPA
ncbi:MAG: hypothetical protein NW223_06695 [Hyphomicrobiaceae bacterium]|nr:hypothetical protein [Hyphomicrobiaceae bacterium]